MRLSPGARHTPTSSYSSFYIHLTAATIRVAVTTEAVADAPSMAADDDDRRCYCSPLFANCLTL